MNGKYYLGIDIGGGRLHPNRQPDAASEISGPVNRDIVVMPEHILPNVSGIEGAL